MVVTKPHVFEADMHHAPRREIAPLFGQLFHSDGLVEALNAASPGLELTPGPSGKTLKLQVGARSVLSAGIAMAMVGGACLTS